MNRNRIDVRDRYIREEIERAVSWTYQPVGKVHPGYGRPLRSKYCVALPRRIAGWDSVARLVFDHNGSASPAERLYQRTVMPCLAAFSFRVLLSRWRSRDQRFLSRAISKSAGMPRFSVRRLICRMDRVRLPL